MNKFLTKHVVCYCCMLLILGFAHCGMTAEEGVVTGVKLSPDLRHLVIQHDGRIGGCATFAMGHPFRLVMDVRSACLAKIPSRIKVDRAPISEIRLGYANSRVRVVVDFGDNPVPPFRMEKGDREIRVSIGKRLALGVDRPARPETRKPATPTWAKAASSTESSKKTAASVKVTAAKVVDNKVLLDLADTRNPGNVYHLSLEMDKHAFKLQEATLRDNHGAVQRFAPTSVKDGTSRVHVETMGPWDCMDTPHENQARPASGKAKFQWGLQATQHVPHTISGPTRQGAFRMEGFLLTPRVNAASKTPD